MQKYVESVQLKDAGLLNSALEKRKEATMYAQGDPGYYAIGKANEAVLLGHHIGDGLAAYEASQMALEFVKPFAKADKKWKSIFRFSPLYDCFGFIGLWAESYEKTIRYAEQANKWVSLPNNADRIKQLKHYQKSGLPWWKMQHSMAQNFYSRTRPELDAGKYAAGMSILHCIIERAITEQPGYEIYSDDMFDLLDDFIILSLQTYNGILKKFTEALNHNPDLKYVDGPTEQFIVFQSPVLSWLQLMPDCPSKWKPTMQKHYEVFTASSYPVYPQIMQKIKEYL
ncbi:MAG: hypothetical protein LBG96_10775 [Tannerella sp.]|nr:hypothetical protein [Tannerella sp.]